MPFPAKDVLSPGLRATVLRGLILILLTTNLMYRDCCDNCI